MLLHNLLPLRCTMLSPHSAHSSPMTLFTGPEKLEYWHHNDAEISSYSYSQAMCGENHERHAVLALVTEPFSAMKNTSKNLHLSKEADLEK